MCHFSLVSVIEFLHFPIVFLSPFHVLTFMLKFSSVFFENVQFLKHISMFSLFIFYFSCLSFPCVFRFRCVSVVFSLCFLVVSTVVQCFPTLFQDFVSQGCVVVSRRCAVVSLSSVLSFLKGVLLLRGVLCVVFPFSLRGVCCCC